MADNTEDQVEFSGESTSDVSPTENEGTDLEGNESNPIGTEEPEQSERAKSRQHELAQKLKAESEAKEAALKRLSRYEAETYKAPELPFLKKPPTQSGVRELSQDEYEAEVSNKANQLVDLKIGQLEQKLSRRESRASDIEFLETKYPELRPGEKQNKFLTKKVISMFQTASEKNPDLSLAGFVEDIMELRSAGQTEGREEVIVERTRNESEAVLTPSVSKAKGLTSEAELEKALAEGKISAKDARKYLMSEE